MIVDLDSLYFSATRIQPAWRKNDTFLRTLTPHIATLQSVLVNLVEADGLQVCPPCEVFTGENYLLAWCHSEPVTPRRPYNQYGLYEANQNRRRVCTLPSRELDQLDAVCAYLLRKPPQRLADIEALSSIRREIATWSC